ncbi:hypothetical protein LSAT2_017592 [Lamellibrachia satsuma]|nr:hypothetical protein LSAT2_017592 [Lamellibrachia satsuma]
MSDVWHKTARNKLAGKDWLKSFLEIAGKWVQCQMCKKLAHEQCTSGYTEFICPNYVRISGASSTTMAQWRHLEELSRTNKDISERIDFIYKGESFIFKIRTLCADFIEKENGMGSASDEAVVPQDLFRGLLGSLEDMGQCGDLKHKMSIKHDIQALKAMSEEAAYQFAQVMKNCMKQEQQLIQSFLCQDDGRHSCMQNVAKENEKITSEINQTAQSLMNLEQKVDQLEKEQDSFNLVHQELTADIGKVAAEVNKAGEVKRLEEQKTALIQNLYCNRTIVAGLLEEMDGPLGGLFDNIWADIDTWKTQQSLQITGIAKPLEGIMDVLGQTCERAGDLLCATQRLAEKILNIYEQLPFQNDPLVAKVTEITGHLDVLLQKHVTKIFVVDKPPPQVIKVVNTKSNVFSMGVRLLGAASLGLHMTMPKVTAELFPRERL